MSLRGLVGWITLIYALYLMVEGALGILGLFGHLTPRLLAAFGSWMSLASDQPWWRVGLGTLAGFTFAVAGAQLAGSPFTAWPLFAMASATEMAARWSMVLGFFQNHWALHELIVVDQFRLTCLAAGLTVYVLLDVRTHRLSPVAASRQNAPVKAPP